MEDQNLILSIAKKWKNIRDIYIANQINEEILKYSNKNSLNQDKYSNIKNSIYNCFDLENLPYSTIPNHVIQIYQDYLKIENLKYINLNLICKSLINPKCKLNNSQKTELLNFLIQSIDSIEVLDGIPLIPLLDNSWTKFDSTCLSQKFFFLIQAINIYSNKN